MKIAYLVNRYPAPSHSFIRREIEGLEALGTEVERFSVRAAKLDTLADQRDQREVSKTSVLLSKSKISLALGLAMRAVLSPKAASRAFRVAFVRADWRPITVIRRLAYLAEAAALATELQQRRIDHLHAHFGTNPAMVARLAGIFSGVPFSFTVHGPDEFDLPLPLDLGGKVGDASFCVAISNFGRSQLMRWSAVQHWSKIEVVSCGVDEHYLALPSTSSATAPVPSQFCVVARLSAQKGIPLLLEAAATVKKLGRYFTLVLVGDGELRTEVERLIVDYGLSEQVTITGWASAEQVSQHVRQSRALILSSFSEGLPVVIMESLALERPVIVTAIAGIPELVDRECGWVIPAGSVERLADAIIDALDAPAERIVAMGREGRRRIVERHDARKSAAKLLRLIRHYNAKAD